MPVTTENNCAICGILAEQRCAGCYLVHYCSRDHQKQHWKIHKSVCRPIKIEEDSVLGRYVIATRPIKPGEAILREKPLVKGPAQVTGPVCLGCGKGITGEDDYQPCSKCGWPVCSERCENSLDHRPECEYTVKRGYKVSIQNFIAPHPSYQCLTLLRCLYLRDHYPEKWQKLMSLESHEKMRVNTPQYDQDRVTAQFILKFFKLENTFQEEEILKVAGILQVNCHEVPLTEPHHIAIYDLCSMIEHNCRANCCKSFSCDGEILIIAGSEIKANDHISFCYVDPLWGAANRRHFLRESKYFQCTCERCQDPTEFGTHFNSMKCQERDCDGELLPKSFILDPNDSNEDDTTNWSCNKCSNVRTSTAIQKLLDHIGEDLQAMTKNDIECCEKFLNYYGKFLHNNHYYLTDVRLALAQMIGQKTKNGLTEIPDEQLVNKARICQRIGDMLKVIAPAELRIRGTVLFELHAAVAEIGRRRASKGEVGPEALEAMLIESKKLLTEAYVLLKNEPEVLPEGKIKLQAKRNLIDMDKLIRTLHQNVGDMP